MKKTGKQVAQELGRREASNVTSRLDNIRTGFSSRLANLVPTRLRWMVPFVQDQVEVPSPTLEALKGKIAQRRFGKEAQQLAETEQTELISPVEILVGVKPLYPKFRCSKGNPLACDFPQQTVLEQPEAKYCNQCGFPTILLPETQIRGNRGIYQVERLLGYRGKGRLYQAVQLPDSQPVVIKEYLLPDRYFNQQETRIRKDAFMRLARVGLADGRVQDFRLISPSEAIADANQPRCYLITKGNLDTSPTLGRYLASNGAMTDRQVYSVLNQVLQSLEFLHEQKFLLTSGLVQRGLSHGNLNLDSLLIVPTFQGFLIYLCDLALWEHRFDPPLTQPSIDSPAQDLKDLGYIAFYLLAGGTVDPVNNQLLDPRLENHWPPVNLTLKNFILNLCGIGLVTFESAEIARKALLKLPIEWAILPSSIVQLVPKQEKIAKKRLRWRWWMLVALGLLLLGILLWFLLHSNSQSNPAFSEPLPCCIKQVSGIPSGTFTYTGEKNSTWSYVIQQDNLIALGKTLETELQTRQPKLKLVYRPEPSFPEAIATIQSGQAQFAVTSLVNELGADLVYKEFARDALVVFVPFSYARRENSFPEALEGKISFEQLRQLYTGQITKWNQLDTHFPNLPVKLYIPDEEEAVKIFEQRVLKDQQAIDSFHKLIEQGIQGDRLLVNNLAITRLPTFETFRAVIRDFETRKIGGIAFGTISKVSGQCSVYPLDLIENNQPPISPLIHNDKTPVTPQTDLCNDKGNYSPNFKALITQSYPLAYSLAVVYPRDNRREQVGSKFAEMLRTVEAQELLSKTGLVPLQLEQ